MKSDAEAVAAYLVMVSQQVQEQLFHVEAEPRRKNQYHPLLLLQLLQLEYEAVAATDAAIDAVASTTAVTWNDDRAATTGNIINNNTATTSYINDNNSGKSTMPPKKLMRLVGQAVTYHQSQSPRCGPSSLQLANSYSVGLSSLLKKLR